MRRPCWVDRLRRGAVVEVGEEPARERARDARAPKSSPSRRRRQPGRGGRRRRRSRRSRSDGSRARGRRPTPPCRSRVTTSLPATIAVEQLAAGRARGLRRSPARPADDHADVGDRVRVRVVEVEPVAEHPVRECRVRRGQRAVERRSPSPGARRRARPSRAALRGDAEGAMLRSRSRARRGSGASRARRRPRGRRRGRGVAHSAIFSAAVIRRSIPCRARERGRGLGRTAPIDHEGPPELDHDLARAG